MPKKISRKKTEHPSGDVERLTHVLNNLPTPSPQRTSSHATLIEQLREPLLQAVIQQGYSVTKLAEILREEGWVIHPSTLRRYLGLSGPHRTVPKATPPASDRNSSPEPIVSAERPSVELSPVESSKAATHLEAALTSVFPTHQSDQTHQTDVTQPDEPAVLPPGTFIPRPERPIDWLPEKVGSPREHR